MNIKILLNKKFAVALSLLAAFAFSGALYAASIFDIEYPIAELGNCADGPSCKAYCNIVDNQQACEDFAAEYNIGTAVKHKENINDLVTDGGPGNCAAGAKNPESSCRSYCDNQAHIRECVAYGKDHNLLQGEDLAEAEKVIRALDSGAKLPAGCTNKNSCRQICENPRDIGIARQCFAFAEQAGLLPPGVDRDKAERTFQLIADGKAPFKSIKDFQQCDNPANDDILQTCVNFAADNGLMSPEEVRIVKETGGKGPGGCIGKAECDIYCEGHQDECFQFAGEHNLMRPEDKARMQEGVRMLKQSMENAPLEIKQCLSQNVGDDVLDQVLGGQKMPSPKIGAAMRSCFESVFSEQPQGNASSTMGRPGQGGEGFGGSSMRDGFPGQSGERGVGRPLQQNFSPEVESCIISKVGEEGLSKIKHPTSRPDQALGVAISGCFRQIEGPRTGPGGCSNAEECKKFCSDSANAEECNIPSRGGMREGSEQGGVPGIPPRNYPSGRIPDRQYDPGQYPMPPQGYGDPSNQGMYAPPSEPIMPPGGGHGDVYSPPPTSFLFGVKNFAATIFSFFVGR